MKRICAAALVILAVMTSCGTTYDFLAKESTTQTVIDLINSGNSAKLAELTVVPSIIEGQIVYSKDDIKEFWKILSDAKYSVKDAKIADVQPADGKHAALFGETKDIALFFAKYPPKNESAVVTVETGKGTLYLLIANRKGDFPQIYGIGGLK
jgi:tRNA1(Val) A37 N6-methylase TrmN6